MPNCGSCGNFAGEEAWRKLCGKCFGKQKRKEEEDREEQIAALMQELAMMRREQRAVALPADRLRQMIQLCHPDKHGGSDLAKDVTQWLLQQKGKRK